MSRANVNESRHRLLIEVMQRAAAELIQHGVGLEQARDELELQYKGSKAAVSARSEADTLERIRQLFDLTLTELGHLFGASRQAVSAWLREGLPPARQPKAVTVCNIAELLERKLKPGRVPAVVRRPSTAYHGKSMLEMIAADRHDQLLREVRESFDWAATS